MTTAEKLVRLRKEKGLSQLQLAEEINVSRQAISRWEVGLAVPSREKLRALSELYNVSVDYLLSDKADENMKKVSEPENEAKEKTSNHLRAGLIACVVVILLIVVSVMLLHLHNTNKPQNEVPISEMETEEDDAESNASATKSTGILNGKRVKALFTAYYPASNKMEGGYYDCKGKKLDPSKYTCAAPSSIKYGNEIQVLGTKTSRDKKVHLVNDRGGAIKVVNGVYHFDLLMKTKAQCNRFGKRTGYAIIGNGTGYKQTSASNTKADKVIKKAKSFIGEVKYVYGASSPQSGKSDCSGFTSYVFRTTAGKNIGRTALAQSQKGTKVQKKNLKKGDLVIFQGTYKAGASHVGIYAGSGKFVHCSSSGGVKVSNLNDSYYVKHWQQGRRVL